MKGTNRLILNQVAMIEAIQFWIDHVFHVDAPVVEAVIADGCVFNIDMVERPDDASEENEG